MGKWRRKKKWKRKYWFRVIGVLLCLWFLFLFFFSTHYPVATKVRVASEQQVQMYHSTYLPLNQIPLPFQTALLETEDRRFYEHCGIDVIGLFRSLLVDIRTGHFTEGGSTITQQLIRNTVLTQEKTIRRKGTEIILALALERFMSKQEILERYFNVIYLGHEAYGVEQASQAYFGKSLSSVGMPEWSLLAGIPAAPSDYDPYVHMDLAKKRQKEILDNLVTTNQLTQQEENKIWTQPIRLKGT